MRTQSFREIPKSFIVIDVIAKNVFAPVTDPLKIFGPIRSMGQIFHFGVAS